MDPNLRREIEDEIVNLEKLRSSEMSVGEVLRSTSTIAQQAVVDRDALVSAGMKWAVVDKVFGYVEVLSEANVERVVTLPEVSEVRKDFNVRYAKAQEFRPMLRMVVEHIVKTTNDPRLQKIYRHISQGNSQVGNLQDNRSYIHLIRMYPHIAKQMRPNGVEMSEAVLEEQDAIAVELLKVLGVSGRPRNEAVDRQNRIITLCLNARSYIKDYAKAAFCKNMAHYDRYYADRSSPVKSGDVPTAS